MGDNKSYTIFVKLINKRFQRNGSWIWCFRKNRQNNWLWIIKLGKDDLAFIIQTDGESVYKA